MMTVTNNGTHVEIHGQSSDGNTPPIIFIHGLGLNKGMWAHQIQPLTPTHQVICYDLYGHGASPPPPETPSLRMFSQQLADLMEALNIAHASVMGFSLGGMITRRFAMDFPDKVTSIGILHSPHKRSKAAHDHIQSRVYQAQKDGADATIEDALIRWFTDDFREAMPPTLDQIRSWVKANDKAIYPAIYQVLVDGVDELIAPQPPISCPALVLTGDEDFGNNPDMSAAIAAEIPQSECVILNGLRHMAMMEAPERFNTVLISFLKKHHYK